MASYLVTGVSRGIGFEFMRRLSSNPENTVVGIVRDKESTEKKIKDELNRNNIFIVQADMTDYESLKRTVSDVSNITHNKLDYVIANAGLVPQWSLYDGFGELGKDPAALEQDLMSCFKTNVIGNINLFNLYIPLVRNGQAKKIITISSGMADPDLITNYYLDVAGPYSISKAGVNVAVAKFHAEYAQEGILFLAICPGSVDTGHYDNSTEEQQKKGAVVFSKLVKYAPHYTKDATVEESVLDMMAVINKASLEEGYGGSFISHLGNKKWL